MSPSWVVCCQRHRALASRTESVCVVRGYEGDWYLPSFAPVEHGKLRKQAPNAKVSKEDSALFVQEQYVFYISDVAALLLIVFMHWQTAHLFPPAFTEPATPSSCQDNSLCLEPGLPWVGSLSAEVKTEQAGTNHPTTPQTKSVQAQYHRYSVLWDKGMAQCCGGAWKPEFNPSWITSPESWCFCFHDPQVNVLCFSHSVTAFPNNDTQKIQNQMVLVVYSLAITLVN